MKKLFTIDLKDYDPNWEKFYRPSVRGIIFDKNRHVAMIYSKNSTSINSQVAESKVAKHT